MKSAHIAERLRDMLTEGQPRVSLSLACTSGDSQLGGTPGLGQVSAARYLIRDIRYEARNVALAGGQRQVADGVEALEGAHHVVAGRHVHDQPG